MEVKAGYKQTEVGVIPEDWKVKKLGELVSLRTGPFGSSVHKSDYINGGIPFINPIHIFNGELFPDPDITLSPETVARLSEFQLRTNDIILGRRGEMGRCAVVQDDQQGWLCGSGSMIVRPNSKIVPEFLQRIMSSSYTIAKIEEASVGSTMINLNQAVLFGLSIPYPSLPEQEAIAEALSDADALIEAMEQLIAKKRQVKHGAMQELLTGNKRLPGFHTKWVDCQLSEIGRFSKGKGIKRDETTLDGIPCIRYGEIYTHHNDYIKEFHSFIPAKIAKQSQRIYKGDLLFTGSGETAEGIGKCVAFLGDEEAYAGGDIVIFTPSNQNALYLGYLMNHTSIVTQKSRMAQGDAIVHISAQKLGQLQLILPSLPEQTAIAEILSDMDAEIAALEEKLAKARQVKQGMMQELLTGRVRLV